MSTITHASLQPRPLVLWSAPRHLSHAFEKMVRNRADHLVFAEPFNDAWYFGPERGTHRIHLPLKPNITYESCLTTILDASKRSRVFVRAQPWQFTPRYFTLQTLQHFRASFLIRDPAYSLPSLYKLKPDLLELEGGIPALHKAWQMLVKTGQPTPIIDATDLQKKPVETVATWCEAVGIKRDDNALKWKQGVEKDWEVWKDYVSTVVSSTGFFPPPKEFPEVKDERLARMIDSSRRYYREMETHKLAT